MSFARDKRLLLGWLALLAPLPLPFNDIVAWPFLAAYWAAVVVFLRRAARDEESWLPAWAMNVLALAYLPFLFFDLGALLRGQPLRPLCHLVLFALAVKLFALEREKDKWHAFLGCFFVTLAAMGSSVHPTVLLYLVAVLALHALVLTRFASLHLLARFGHRGRAPAAVPVGRILTVGTTLTLLAAIPIFLLLPRIRSPYIVAGGPVGTTLATSTSFSDELTLDAIGRLRTSRAVALRFERRSREADRDQEAALGIRFKAASYDLYRDGAWRPGRGDERFLQRGGSPFFDLAGTAAREAGPAAPPAAALTVWLMPTGTGQLPLPVGSLRAQAQATGLVIDRGGDVRLPFNPRDTFSYEVTVGSRPRPRALPPPGVGEGSALDTGGLAPEVARLAGEVLGSGGAAERAARLEAWLQREYDYTLEFLGRGGARPIEEFLLENRRGHCELFASAMVLMLRSQGIPARLATGFLGAEYNPLEDYYMVRQSNRHAWVEAWDPAAGWLLFDPTPAAGRPGAGEADLARLLGQAWDFLVFRWDRYVLTYGLGDQLGIFVALRDAWGSFWDVFRMPELPRFGEGVAEEAAPADPGGGAAEPEAEERPGLERLAWLAPVILLSVVAFWLWRRRHPATAVAAYRRLRRRLQAVGLELTEATPPLEVGRRLGERFPASREPGHRVVELYLRESFGGEELGGEEREELARSLEDAVGGLRRKAG